MGLGSGGSEKEQEGENGGRGGERGREGVREWRKWRMGRKGRGGAPWRSATAKSEERRWLRAGGVFNEVSEQGDRRRLRWRVAADEMGGVRGGGVRCLVD